MPQTNSDITCESVYLLRREFLKKAVKFGLIAGMPMSLQVAAGGSAELRSIITAERLATGYNNYYEFSTNKKAVAHIAKDFTMSPWRLSIDGLVDKPMDIGVDDLGEAKDAIYRFRCVEGWSMVVPWQGIQLATLLKKAKPKPEAKFVQFVSVYRPAEMIGQRRSALPWPYTEALRIDEAMHPLTLLATGMYNKPLLPQNGGPLRLVVPWKYGYKSIKAIEKIELVAERPETSWNQAAPSEYGFYGNVNPSVPHPRWSQRREVPLGQLKKVDTLQFNGYAGEVAQLYEGMDLKKYY